MTGDRYYFVAEGQSDVHQILKLEIWDDTGEVYSEAPGPKNRFMLQREGISLVLPLRPDEQHYFAFGRTEKAYLTAIGVHVDGSNYGYYRDVEHLQSVLTVLYTDEVTLLMKQVSQAEYEVLRERALQLLIPALANRPAQKGGQAA